MMEKDGLVPSAGVQALLLAALLFAVIILSTGMGYIKITPLKVIKIVVSRIYFDRYSNSNIGRVKYHEAE